MKLFSPVYTSGIFALMHHLLDNPVEDILRFRGVCASNASLYGQSSTSIKALYERTSKPRATRIDEIVLCLYQKQTNTPLEA